jgi:hypothetical protein
MRALLLVILALAHLTRSQVRPALAGDPVHCTTREDP